MAADQPHLDPDSEVARAVEALNELRDVLIDVSLGLKDLKAKQDFADHGSGWKQSTALLEGLFSSLQSVQAARSGTAGNSSGGGG